jgi:DNA polymerase-3 subunit beta
VATNGQRLATSKVDTAAGLEGTNQFIVPRKGVIELARLVKDAGESNVDLQLSANHLRVVSGESSLTTKLIDGKYPDYNRAIPENGDKLVTADRLELREALSRIAILSNEMYRNVKLHLSDGKLRLHANNPQHEEAEESVTVDYEGEELEIGFNVSYLIDVLSTLQGEKVAIVLSDSNGAAVITSPEDDLSRFVVSPMML